LTPSGALTVRVHVQHVARGSANRSVTGDRSGVDIDLKMLAPPILSRMKQPDCRLRLYILDLRVIAFEKIARAARQSPIVQAIVATSVRRDDVFYFEGKVENGFRCAAVFAAVTRSFRDGLIVPVHFDDSSAIACARRPAAWTSVSTSASNSACSSGESSEASSRAVRQRVINSSSRRRCSAVKNRSGRWFCTTTSVLDSS
jgi:hypothetical protein